MENKIVLIGAGGHCKSVIDAVIRSSKYSDIVITDSVVTSGSKILGCKVVGNDNILPKLHNDGFERAFVTVGSIKDCTVRIKLVKMAKKIGFDFPIIIDPSAQVSKYAKIGDGTFIGKNVVINADAQIGEHCIINTGAIVEHDCIIKDFCHISVGAILCGNTVVEKQTFVGAGTTVIQGSSVGRNSVIGAHSTVLRNVGNDITGYGLLK